MASSQIKNYEMLQGQGQSPIPDYDALNPQVAATADDNDGYLHAASTNDNDGYLEVEGEMPEYIELEPHTPAQEMPADTPAPEATYQNNVSGKMSGNNGASKWFIIAIIASGLFLLSLIANIVLLVMFVLPGTSCACKFIYILFKINFFDAFIDYLLIIILLKLSTIGIFVKNLSSNNSVKLNFYLCPFKVHHYVVGN